MDYERIYKNICDNGKNRNWTKRTAPVYVERHHIIPRSLGGDNSKENLVFLTGREHFICHMFLVKFVVGKNKYKMAAALSKMMQSNKFQDRKINSRTYETARILFSKNNPFKSEEVRAIVKQRMTGESNPMKNPMIVKKSQEGRIKQIGPLNGFYGKKHTPETLVKISGKNYYMHREGYIPHKMSDEEKKNISIRNKGRKRPDLSMRNASDAPEWEIILPTGDRIIIKNLFKYARDNKINHYWLYNSLHGYQVKKIS